MTTYDIWVSTNIDLKNKEKELVIWEVDICKMIKYARE